MGAKAFGTLVIGAEEYVVLPRAEYLRVKSPARDEGMLLGRRLRAARDHAQLTQAALAKKLRRSQSTVSQAEAGTIRVSAAYVRRLFKTCGLPEDWKGS